MVRYPSQVQRKNLRQLGVYVLVYSYLRSLWKNDFTLIQDTAVFSDGTPFFPHDTHCYPYVHVGGMKYGASTFLCGRGNRYAYIHGRQAVDILNIMKISVETAEGLTLNADIAIVRRFIASPHAPQMPWATR